MGCILGERESLDLIKERCNKHGGPTLLPQRHQMITTQTEERFSYLILIRPIKFIPEKLS